MNLYPLRLAAAGIVTAAAAFSTPAATLEVAWTPNALEPHPHYRLHVGTEAGRYTRVVEASEPRAILTDLADDQVYFLRVEELEPGSKPGSRKAAKADRAGKSPEALAVSAEIVTLPSPRIEAVGSFMPAGQADTWTFTVQGRNFAEGAAVRTNQASLRVLATERDASGQLRVTVRHEPEFGSVGLPVLSEASIVVINPGLKSPEYFAARPERADVDGNGRVDESDLVALEGRFGMSVARDGARDAATASSDLNGDGAVDGLDLDLMGRVLRAR